MAVIEAIATTYLEADAASVTFSGIPSTYEHLQLRMSLLCDRTATDNWYVYMRFNSDSGANYSQHRMFANGGAGTTGAGNTGETAFWIPHLQTLGGAAANYGPYVIDVFDYASTNKNTTFSCLGGSGAESTMAGLFSGLWDDTAALTTIWLAPDAAASAPVWQRGSVFTLYGLNSA